MTFRLLKSTEFVETAETFPFPKLKPTGPNSVFQVFILASLLQVIWALLLVILFIAKPLGSTQDWQVVTSIKSIAKSPW